MKPPQRGAYLSISAGAAREYFDDGIRGLRIRTLDDDITLKGAETRSGTDIVAIEQRGRGGLAATVEPEDNNAVELFRLFRRHGFKSSAPFFLLVERPRKWVGLEHWDRPNPPINRPYLRVWMSDTPVGRGRRASTPIERPAATRPYQRRPLDDDDPPPRRAYQREPVMDEPDDTIDWRQVRRILIESKELISRRGRPSQAQEAARESARNHLDQFERVLEAVMPGRGINALQARLDRAMARMEDAEKERDEAHEEVEALQQVLTETREELEQLRRTPAQDEPPPPRRRGGRRRRQFADSEPPPIEWGSGHERIGEDEQPQDFIEEESVETDEATQTAAYDGDGDGEETAGKAGEETVEQDNKNADEDEEGGEEKVETESDPKPETEPADQPPSSQPTEAEEDEYDPLIDPHSRPAARYHD